MIKRLFTRFFALLIVLTMMFDLPTFAVDDYWQAIPEGLNPQNTNNGGNGSGIGEGDESGMVSMLSMAGVTIGAQNIRSGPGVSHSILKTLSTDSDVHILGVDATSKWMQVEYEKGKLGYISNKSNTVAVLTGRVGQVFAETPIWFDSTGTGRPIDTPSVARHAFVLILDKNVVGSRYQILFDGNRRGWIDKAGVVIPQGIVDLEEANPGRVDNTMRHLRYQSGFTNVVGKRGPEAYAAVIDSYAKDLIKNRYARTVNTYCNIFNWDVMSAVGAEFPHWMMPDGKTPYNPTIYEVFSYTTGLFGNGTRATEVNANTFYNWVAQNGVNYGWVEVDPTIAQNRANNGFPTITTWFNTTGASGHVQVVRPETRILTPGSNRWHYTSAKGAVVSQAGSTNFRYGNVNGTNGTLGTPSGTQDPRSNSVMVVEGGGSALSNTVTVYSAANLVNVKYYTCEGAGDNIRRIHQDDPGYEGVEIPPEVLEIGLSISGTHTFQEQNVGYASVTPRSVTVTNSNNVSVSGLIVALSGENPGSFTLSKTGINSIAAGSTDTFTVVPNTGLGKGTYNAIVTVSGANTPAQYFNVSFTVHVPVTGITLNTNAIEMSDFNTTEILVESVSPADASNTTVIWRSSDDTIATVSNGTVTALNPGSAIITVATEDGGFEAHCTVTVTQQIPGVRLSISKLSLTVGNSAEIMVLIESEDAVESILWELSGDDCVMLDGMDRNPVLVTATAAGTASVKITVRDVYGKERSASFVVTVSSASSSNPVTRVIIKAGDILLDEGAEITLNKDTEQTLSAVIDPEEARNTAVEWSSSNPLAVSVATVREADSHTVVIKGLNPGTSIITATTVDGSHKATVKITVPGDIILPADIRLNQTKLTLNKGTSEVLSAAILPEDASNQTVTWISGNEDIATVDDNGLVTAIGNGDTTITAITSNNLTAICDVTVETLPTGITINESELILKIGETGELTADVLPEDTTNQALEWLSDAPEIVSIDKDTGLITAVDVGTATITARTINGITAECVVKVEAPVEDVTKPVDVKKPAEHVINVFGGTVNRNKATKGVSVTAKVVVPNGKVFTGWIANGIALTNVQKKALSITFTMPDNAVTLTAKFENKVNAQAPKIKEQPKKSQKVVLKAKNVTLHVSASGDKLSYQWYVKKTLKGKESKAKSGKNATYEIPTKKAGTFYYYCKITNENASVTGEKKAVTLTRTSKVIVQKKTAKPKKSAVPANKTVKRGSDITLTAPKGTTLYYTRNGKKPNTKSTKVKAGKKKTIKIHTKTTVKVIAIKKGYAKSEVVTRRYKVY